MCSGVFRTGKTNGTAGPELNMPKRGGGAEAFRALFLFFAFLLSFFLFSLSFIFSSILPFLSSSFLSSDHVVLEAYMPIFLL